jgi:nitrate/nitrite transport system substrate-binding protein
MLWTLRAMQRAGQIGATADLRALATQVAAADTYRAAAAELGLAAPTTDYKSEGTHATHWTLHQATRPIAMGPDRLLAGRVFDPALLESSRRASGEEAMKRDRANPRSAKE